MTISRKSFTTIELIIVLGLLGSATGFISKIHLPWVKTKADVQKELAVEKQSHELTKQELASQSKLTDEQKKLLADYKKASEDQAILDQSAANAVAKITAVNQLSPPMTRKDKMVDYAAQEATKALPAPTDYAAILQLVKDQLDELKTSNAQLDAQHKTDLGVIDGQKQELARAEAALVIQQKAVAGQEKVNADQKAANELQRKTLEAKEGLLAQALAGLDRLKYAIMGLVGLAGLLCIAAGSFLGNKILIPKGILLVILAVMGMIIPITWYLAVVGLAMLAVVAYVVSQWHKEKSIADNAVGILQETKEKVPEVWASTIKPITQSYWGTAEKDVTKANAWVAQKLYSMNLLHEDKKP